MTGNPLWFLRCSSRIYCGMPAACHVQVCQGAETRENCHREDWADVLEPVMQLDSTLLFFFLWFFVGLFFVVVVWARWHTSAPTSLLDRCYFFQNNSGYSSGLPLHRIMYYFYSCWGTFQQKFILSCEVKWHWNAIILSAVITMATAAGRQGKLGILILYHMYTNCFSSLSVMTLRSLWHRLLSCH